MKSGKSWWRTIGFIIGEGFLFVDMGIDLYTGETTWTELILKLAFCALIAGFAVSLLMRKKRKSRGQQ